MWEPFDMISQHPYLPLKIYIWGVTLSICNSWVRSSINIPPELICDKDRLTSFSGIEILLKWLQVLNRNIFCFILVVSIGRIFSRVTPRTSCHSHFSPSHGICKGSSLVDVSQWSAFLERVELICFRLSWWDSAFFFPHCSRGERGFISGWLGPIWRPMFSLGGCCPWEEGFETKNVKKPCLLPYSFISSWHSELLPATFPSGGEKGHFLWVPLFPRVAWKCLELIRPELSL